MMFQVGGKVSTKMVERPRSSKTDHEMWQQVSIGGEMCVKIRSSGRSGGCVGMYVYLELGGV